MRTVKAVLAFLLLVAVSLASAAIPENTLPRSAVDALSAHGEVIIYSLEPGRHPDASNPQLQDVKVLGQASLDKAQTATAIGAFKKAIADWNGVFSACFEPRHAIRITANTHTYDFLLCYECHQLSVFEDDKFLKNLGVAGHPKSSMVC